MPRVAAASAPACCARPPTAHLPVRASPPLRSPAGGQSELESTLNLNAMNQSPNPWHVSFSYARALQNSVLKTWKGEEGNVQAAQEALLKRASANSAAQLGKYDPSNESADAAKGMFEASGGGGLRRPAACDAPAQAPQCPPFMPPFLTLPPPPPPLGPCLRAEGLRVLSAARPSSSRMLLGASR